MCICLIGDCRHAVKISTRLIQMRSGLLKGMGAGTLIGLLHVTPKPHLRAIRLLQTNPSDQPFRPTHDSCVGRKSQLCHRTAHKATCAWRFSLVFQTVKIGPSVFQTLNGQLTDCPLEVSLMLRAAEDPPDPEGPGAVFLLLDWFQLDQELILVEERPPETIETSSWWNSEPPSGGWSEAEEEEQRGSGGRPKPVTEVEEQLRETTSPCGGSGEGRGLL